MLSSEGDGPGIDYILENEKKYPRAQIDAELIKMGYTPAIIQEFWTGIEAGYRDIAQANMDANAESVPRMTERPWTFPMELAFGGLLLAGAAVIGSIFNWPEESGDRGLGIGFAIVGDVLWFVVLRFAFAKYRGVLGTSLMDARPYTAVWNALPRGLQRYAVHVTVVTVIAAAWLLLSGRGL